MLLTILRCKLHRATVTECDLNYQGSLKIDADLIRASGLLVNEYIEVYNIDNGERFSTYVIEGKAGSGEILVADTVRGLCSGKGFLFADRGEFVAKGFEEPVRVYEVGWQG